MIIEGLITTLNSDGSAHFTAMGPWFEPDDNGRFELRPFEGSTTLQNLSRTGVGVFHAVDDVDLMARAALGRLEVAPEIQPARSIDGVVLESACQWWEFRVADHEASPPRHRLRCETVERGIGPAFRGFNRAEHAILEAAILATRVHLVPREQIEAELERLEVWVTKTAGPSQQATWSWLMDELRQRWRRLAERADESEPRSS